MSQHQDLGKALDQKGREGGGASGVGTNPSLFSLTSQVLTHLQGPGLPCCTLPISPHGAAAQIRPLALSLPGAKQGLGEEPGFLWQPLHKSASLTDSSPGFLDTHPHSCS